MSANRNNILPVAISALALFTLSVSGTPTGRIVGGWDAASNQFPYQISLRIRGSHTCGGSIISPNHILTAAHCVTSQDSDGKITKISPKSFTIRAGVTDRFSGGMLINVADIIVHESYGNFLNDVAILILERPLIYSSSIQPIALAKTETPTGVDIIISGWGRISTGGDVPRDMKYNILTSLSATRCKTSTLMFTNSLLCLAHTAGNGACNGDSGGPAAYKGELVGIAGFVMNGCGSNLPDGYANVFYHRDWIVKNAKL